MVRHGTISLTLRVVFDNQFTDRLPPLRAARCSDLRECSDLNDAISMVLSCLVTPMRLQNSRHQKPRYSRDGADRNIGIRDHPSLRRVCRSPGSAYA